VENDLIITKGGSNNFTMEKCVPEIHLWK